MNTTANTNNVATISKKPSTKQEIIAANVKLLIEQLEAGRSECLTNYLDRHEPLSPIFLRKRVGNFAANVHSDPSSGSSGHGRILAAM